MSFNTITSPRQEKLALHRYSVLNTLDQRYPEARQSEAMWIPLKQNQDGEEVTGTSSPDEKSPVRSVTQTVARGPESGRSRIGLSAGIAGLVLTEMVLSTLGASQETTKPTLFVGDFEAGDLSGWRTNEQCCPHSINVVQEPVRAGANAVRFEVRQDDPNVANSKRAELKLEPVPASSERWYAVSIYLPKDYRKDPTPEIVTQWHATPDFDKGETWRSPPLALLTHEGKWRIGWRWDSARVTQGNSPEGTLGRTVGNYQTGRWTDWVFHVKWSWKENGLLQVWKNGKQVIHHKGPNAYHDKRGPYFKTGIYKWPFKTQPKETTVKKRILYVDEVRIGGAGTTLDELKPPERKAVATPNNR